MKQLLGAIRRADQDFDLIQTGDRVCVGVSGGKDSLALLCALALYRRFAPRPFELEAVTVSLGLEPFDLSGVTALCARLGVPYTVEETQIGPIVFEQRREKNPCALCAKMRRGALVSVCQKRGLNKLALGHHRDDAIETLMLSVLQEGRMATLQPATRLEGSGVTQIRPLIYAPEKDIRHVVRAMDLPVVPSPCPANGETRRADMKALLRQICAVAPDAREKIAAALKNDAQYALWSKPQKEGPDRSAGAE